MTDPTASGTPASTPGNAAPGWYPDASGAQRWWDGQGWTAHVAAPAAPAPAPGQAYERPQLAAGTRIDTAWTWVTALVTFVAVLPVFFFDFGGYMRAMMLIEMGDGSGVGPAISGFIGWYVVIMLVSTATYALSVIAAYRDYKHLTTVGVVRPFHWAFTFIGAIVYLIGRHVILRKVSTTSGAPLWVHISLYVVTFIGSMVWTVAITQSMMSTIAELSYYGFS